jgi:uncharacterized protein DUF4242
MPVYVGERYIPEAERSVALEQAERLRSAVLQAAPAGAPVRLLSTTFVPNEEWVFDLFEADSADQVRRIYEVSGVPVERVTEGVHLPGP